MNWRASRCLLLRAWRAFTRFPSPLLLQLPWPSDGQLGQNHVVKQFVEFLTGGAQIPARFSAELADHLGCQGLVGVAADQDGRKDRNHIVCDFGNVLHRFVSYAKSCDSSLPSAVRV